MSYHQDLDNMTRDMHDKSWEVEYCQKNPVLAMMLERKDLKFKGGKQYYKEVDTDSMEDLVQDYDTNEQLSHGVDDTSERVTFRRKKFQAPIQVDIDEDLQNMEQTSDGTQLQPLAKKRVQKIQEAVRFHMRKRMYMSANSDFATQPTDTNKRMQSLNSALEVDTTYGQVTRTYATGVTGDVGHWFQPMGGDISQSVQATETAIGINVMRNWFEPLEDLESDNKDLVTILGGVLWLSLQAEAEAKNVPYTLEKKRVARQGFSEMILDDRRIIKDPFLKAKNNTKMGETSGSTGALERRIYGLNLKKWDFIIHPKRNFKLTEFFDQSKIVNGTDMRLARILWAGNLVCWSPGSQLYYENVTP